MKKLFITISVLLLMLMCSISVSAISGEGTEENPFLIETEEDFLLIGYFPEQTFKLVADISVNTTLDSFNGVLDGSGFKVTTTKDYIFLNNSGEITNLSISGGNIASVNLESGNIENCTATDTVIVTTNDGTLCNIQSNTNITKNNNGIIKKCLTSSGHVAVNNYANGIISNCLESLHIADNNCGLIESCSSISGYLVNNNTGIIINSSTTNYFLASSNEGTIKSSFSTGNKTIDNKAAFVISNHGTIDLCYSDLDIDHYYYNGVTYTNFNYVTGGLVAYNYGTIYRSFYEGTVDVGVKVLSHKENGINTCYIGGIAGKNNGYIRNCYSKGNLQATFTSVSNTNYLYGDSYLWIAAITATGGNVENCYSNMKIAATTHEDRFFDMTVYAYGIAGNSQIKNCYYAGNDISLDGTYYASTQTTIGTTQWYQKSFSKTVIAGCGGIFEDNSIENSYYLSDSPFEDDSTCGTPASASIMKMQILYTDWDFDTVWAIDSETNDGYPYLQWQPKEEEPEEIISVESLSVDKDEIVLKVNETIKLTAAISPSNATNKNVTWSSSNTNVVTVDNGVISAVGEGSATIVIKTEDGGHIALCSVEVLGIMIKNTEMNINNYNKANDTVSFDINLSSPTDITGTVLVVLYNKNDTIVAIKTYTPSSEINVLLDSTESNYIKVMWWDMNTLIPLTDYIQIDL